MDKRQFERSNFNDYELDIILKKIKSKPKKDKQQTIQWLEAA